MHKQKFPGFRITLQGANMLQIWPCICRTWYKLHSVERCSRSSSFHPASLFFSCLGDGKQRVPGCEVFPLVSHPRLQTPRRFSPSYLFPWPCEKIETARECARMCAVNIPFTRLVLPQQRNLSRVNRV